MNDVCRAARHRRWGTALVAVVALALVACEPVMPAGIGTPSADPVPSAPYLTTLLTRQGTDRFDLNGGTGTMVVTAPPSNQGVNTRALFVADGTPVSFDQESCASWTQERGRLVQQGIALRVRREAGGTRAVTVTRNIYGYPIFNIHVWAPGRGFELIGRADLSDVVVQPGGALRPFPWHICARGIGDKVEVKVWTGSEPTPAWGDARHSRVNQLPSGWVYAGRPGGYIGHLGAGDSASFANLRTATYPRPRADAETVTRALYDKVQRRTPTATDVELWKTRLQDGWTRQRAAQTFATDVHGRRISIDDAYRLILSRPVDSSGLTHWTSHLDQGRTYRSFIGALGNATSFPRTRAGDEAYVAHLWQAVLGRPSSAQDRSEWADRLGSGWTRRSVAEYVWGSGEARNHQARLAFVDVVGRAPTTAERDHWAARYAALGSDPVRLRAEIVIETIAVPSPDHENAGPPVVVDPPPTTTTTAPPETTTTVPPTTTAPTTTSAPSPTSPTTVPSGEFSTAGARPGG